MIAVELASRLGGDLGASTLDELWAEIERVSPLHQGVSQALLMSRQRPQRRRRAARGRRRADQGSRRGARAPRPDGRPRHRLGRYPSAPAVRRSARWSRRPAARGALDGRRPAPPQLTPPARREVENADLSGAGPSQASARAVHQAPSGAATGTERDAPCA